MLRTPPKAGIFFGSRFQNVILDYEYQTPKIRPSGVRGWKPPDRGKNSSGVGGNLQFNIWINNR